jgi:hypothetical protein
MGREEAVVAVAVNARRRDEAGDAFEKLHRGEPELGAAARVRGRETVDEPGVG